ncbi:ATP-grasp domain-containing protein [Cetobacterium somerae]
MKKILILTDYRNSFRREEKSYYSLSLNKMREVFIKNSYEVEVLSYIDIINLGLENIENQNIVYTSSADDNYKKYIDDIVFYLKDKNKIFPKYELLKCQENKGFQELYKLKQGIKSLKYYYLCNLKDLNKVENKLTYPIIMKKINGAGSSQVFKINSKNELIDKIKKNIKTQEYIKKYLKKKISEIIIKLKLDRKNLKKYQNYVLEEINMEPFVLQEFVPDLESDWKILVFGKKYYALNRRVREGDFRASGSGKLFFIEPPESVLNYAEKIYKKLDTPIASLDICINKNNECNLIEFQSLHFGPYTIMKSNYYYEKINSNWKQIFKKSNLSEEYANAMVEYINDKK